MFKSRQVPFVVTCHIFPLYNCRIQPQSVLWSHTQSEIASFDVRTLTFVRHTIIYISTLHLLIFIESSSNEQNSVNVLSGLCPITPKYAPKKHYFLNWCYMTSEKFNLMDFFTGDVFISHSVLIQDVWICGKSKWITLSKLLLLLEKLLICVRTLCVAIAIVY